MEDLMREHEEMVESHIVWVDGAKETETNRPICRYCWKESPIGEVVREDWPCPTVRAFRWASTSQSHGSGRHLQP